MGDFRLKLWVGIGASLLAGGAPAPVLAHTQPAAPGVTAQAAPEAKGHAGHGAHGQAKPGEGGEGGEGGEAGALADLPSEAAFAAQLHLMLGHLRVGQELLDQKRAEDAVFHFLHPAEEIYGGIADALAARKVPPFQADLEALAGLVEKRAPAKDVKAATARVTAAIDRALATVPAAESASPGFTLKVAIGLLRTAAEEYAAAIKDGRFALAVEYQDSRGFVWQARSLLEARADAFRAKDADAYSEILATMNDLQKAWPGAMPPTAPVVSAADVAAAVSRIELRAGRFS